MPVLFLDNMVSIEVNGIGNNSSASPEPIAFLVGSWNRFEVLNALRKSSRTRDNLKELTGVSRPTLIRILSDLSDQGWIRRHNDEFEATPKGRVIASEIGQTVADIETAEALDGTLEWLSTEFLGFDLAHLSSAEMLTPRIEDQTGPMRRLADFIQKTPEIRIVATGVTYEIVDTLCQSCLAGDLTIRCVVSDRALDGIRSHEKLAEKFPEIVGREHGEAWRYDGRDDLVDCNLLDNAVMFVDIVTTADRRVSCSPKTQPCGPGQSIT
jgi:predicted transcriptional regulator